MGIDPQILFPVVTASEARGMSNKNMRATFDEIMRGILDQTAKGKFSLKMEKDFCEHFKRLEKMGYSIVTEPSDGSLAGIIYW